MFSLVKVFNKINLNCLDLHLCTAQSGLIFVRGLKEKRVFVEKPKPGNGQQFRIKVHFPSEYTIEPLDVTHLGGRDPVTGRKVCEGIGGGIKHKYHWIKWMRDGPSDDVPPQEEKVIKIFRSPYRTAFVALVAVKDEMKYILATENMKEGDIIKTSKFLPKNPVKATEGDAYPLGALPIGTVIHNVQLNLDSEYTVIHSAGSSALIKRHLGSEIVVQLSSKLEMAINPLCMATVGRLSNAIHGSTPIGSPNKLRELGYRPRSGLWHRKTGIHGRKIKPLPPVQHYKSPPPPVEYIRCTHNRYKI
ncbi:50S ribosomal protein L2, putative [Pediculus humanus corporis]|uniref:50S ribosomal protein L2, putative n=1 Tax=Pediculus humanus subsp. corporis TaxID=121224 RepID=E0W2B4_PEDHC|nr:50S ribosomal protein L2, putative [Pediculus humanus corporis]EEB19770.1 50S ribosomal protein L2, putative [Pediculus humanus corporis]